MKFCLGLLNNVLNVFFPEVCFLFEILHIRKKYLSKGILWRLVESKTKETFCFAKR